MPVKTIEWKDGKVRLIDQTRLPQELVYIETDDLDTLGEAIRSLRVRGAPAIGIAAAFGVVIGVHNAPDEPEAFFRQLHSTIAFLRQTRPTAVNLFWALDRMQKVAESQRDRPVPQIKAALLAEAQRILEEDRRVCREIGRHGAELLPDPAVVLTHCNTGALATADYGTALGVVYAAVEQGKRVHVYADETRPLLQGSRLNAWELMQEGIPVTILPDSAAGFVMQQGKVDCVLVGADRIASNGDTANKIGTYTLAVLAKKHGIPFYVAAPISTIDLSLASGDEIPIEERSPDEVTTCGGTRIAPAGVQVYNPAFDLTPHELIAAIITEAGVIRPPFSENLRALAC
jgi:methylthioribose-1-phosphate isomerase